MQAASLAYLLSNPTLISGRVKLLTVTVKLSMLIQLHVRTHAAEESHRARAIIKKQKSSILVKEVGF